MLTIILSGWLVVVDARLQGTLLSPERSEDKTQ
jgi:hypothetical protein